MFFEKCNEDYLLIFPISHNTKAITRTTTITPTHIPALKMSAIAWQLESREVPAKKRVANITLFLIVFYFKYLKTICLLTPWIFPVFHALPG